MKSLIVLLLRATFVLHILRFLNRKKITILMLHGVAGEHPDEAWQPLWPRPTPEDLDRVLGHLSQHYRFISIDDAADIIEGRKPPVRNGLVITFDDGYRNNVAEALPVLRKHGVPAAFYIATGFVESGASFWIDRLDYALQVAPDEARLIEAIGRTFDLRHLDRASLGERYRQMRLAVKESVADDETMLATFDEVSTQLEQAAGASITDIIDSDPWVSIATWSELRDASSAGVEIGSHTVDHCRLTAISRDAVATQLSASKQAVENGVKLACEHFCYPNGDFDTSIAEQVRSAGYRSAVTTQKGQNRIGDDLMTLRRYPMPCKADAFGNLLAVSGFGELPGIRHVAKRL